MSDLLPLDRANYHLNRRAAAICERLTRDAARCRVIIRDTGLFAPIIDCGIETPGSLEAGLLLTRAAMADLGEVWLSSGDPAIGSGPFVHVRSDHPVLACMFAQYAGWQITGEKYFAMGSGPMRAAAYKEELFARLGYRETTTQAVGVLETRQLPPPQVAEQVARDCDVDVRQLTLLIAPTASLAGTIQIAARSLETALHKLDELGFDLWRVVAGYGSAPLPPVARDDLMAIGWTNDAILYGGHVTLWVTGDDESVENIIARVPSSASPDHGRPFADIFAAYEHDFYKIDPHLFSPARIEIHNLRTGHTFSAGQVQPEVIQASWNGAQG